MGGPPRVCYYWSAGRCNRHPCPFLHVDGGAPAKRAPNCPPKPLVWRNPRTYDTAEASRKSSTDKAESSSSGKRSSGKADDDLVSPPHKDKKADDDLVSKKFISSGSSFSLVATLDHSTNGGITGIAYPQSSDAACCRIYSGCKDGSICAWDCTTGHCVGVVNVGGAVGCMISHGPWLFAGIPNAAVKAFNTNTDLSLCLTAAEAGFGQVYALAVAHEIIFAGTHDGHILAWNYTTAASSPANNMPSASLHAHKLGVVSLLVVDTCRLFSASVDSTIKVWDNHLNCLQTVTDQHNSVVMSLIRWEEFFLSCSLDQTIKVWAASAAADDGQLLHPIYTHTEQHGLLLLSVTQDARGKPVLLCSRNDNTVALYDLPSFAERGTIFCEKEVRALQVMPQAGLFFTGDASGELKVWRWSPDEEPAAAAANN